MVDQSELAFRTLCREFGVGLCYTPMMHARLMTEHKTYAALHFDAGEAEDRPLFGQLAGHDPAVVLAAARRIEDKVDAVDLNFGCPQGIARKGRYGAFLLEEPGVPVALVETLARELTVPVTAKVRILPDESGGLERTTELCQQMQEAGAAVICVHGRTRQQNKQKSGAASWDCVRRLVGALDVPVIANGGVGSMDEAEACLATTGAAAVMSSEALLENPALFCRNRDPRTGAYLDQDELARRYLELCEAQPPSKGLAMSRGHLFKLLHNGLRERTDVRDALLVARGTADLSAVAARLAEAGWRQPRFHAAEHAPELSWYHRHRQAAAVAAAEPSPQRRMADAPPLHAAAAAADGAAAAALRKRERKQADVRRRRNTRDAARRERRAAAQLHDATQGLKRH